MRNLIVIVPLILLFAIIVNADVPPDSGKKRVSLNLITETSEDLSPYRFFIDFYGDLKEVEVKSHGRTEIPPMGGGARYSSGTLIAVPKKSLRGFEEKPSAEKSNELSRALKNKEIDGAVELAKHRFSMDIPTGEKPPEVFYVLKSSENTLKAERVTTENPDRENQADLFSSQTGLIVGGLFLSLAVLLAGIFAFRKVAKKV